jgi:hypothetical protein
MMEEIATKNTIDLRNDTCEYMSSYQFMEDEARLDAGEYYLKYVDFLIF